MLSQNVHLLDAEANRLYLDALKEAAPESYVPMVATVRGTTKRTETSPILGDAPAMTEMQLHQPYTFTPIISDVVSTTMRKFGAGVEISEEDWEDDQLGGFAERVRDMGREGIALPNALLMALLVNGDTQNGWDGVPFFSASHPAKGKQPAAWSNLLAGTAATAAGFYTDINRAIEFFGSFRMLNGRQANSRIRKICICAPWGMRQEILEATQPNRALTNSAAIQGLEFEYIFDSDLGDDDPNDVYVLNVSYELRPLVLWQRKAAALIPEMPNTGAGFVNDVRRYKSKWRGAPAYGPPQRAIKFTYA